VFVLALAALRRADFPSKESIKLKFENQFCICTGQTTYSDKRKKKKKKKKKYLASYVRVSRRNAYKSSWKVSAVVLS
jgi:hypothetical protein